MIHSLITVLIRGNWPPSIFQLVSACSFLPFFLYLLFLLLWRSVEWQSEARVRGRWARLFPQSIQLRSSWLLLLEGLVQAWGRDSTPWVLYLTHFCLDRCLCFALLPSIGSGETGVGVLQAYDSDITSLDEMILISPFFLGLVSSLPEQWSHWPCSHIHCWSW